jgi:hypothetical protein
MIFDSQLMYSDDQSLIATAYSDNVIPMPDDVDNVALHLICTEVVGADSTLTAALETSADNLAWRTVFALVKPAGFRTFGARLRGTDVDNYTRLTYTVGGAAPEFTVTAALVTGEQSNALYPDGI